MKSIEKSAARFASYRIGALTLIGRLCNLEQHEGLGLDFHEAIDIWRPRGILFPHDRDGTFCPWVGQLLGLFEGRMFKFRLNDLS